MAHFEQLIYIDCVSCQHYLSLSTHTISLLSFVLAASKAMRIIKSAVRDAFFYKPLPLMSFDFSAER